MRMIKADGRLSSVRTGSPCTVVEIRGGIKVRQRIAKLGLLPGVEVTIEKKAGFNGGLLLNIEGRRVGVGRTVADKILVEHCR